MGCKTNENVREQIKKSKKRSVILTFLEDGEGAIVANPENTSRRRFQEEKFARNSGLLMTAYINMYILTLKL